MVDTQPQGEMAANTPNGWIIDDPAAYHFLNSQNPPRRGSFLHVLKADARTPQVLRYWAEGGGLIALGVVCGLIGPRVGMAWLVVLALGMAGAGGGVLFLWVRLFLAAVRNHRLGLLFRGEIRSLGAPILARGSSRADARLPDGQFILVAVRTALASELLLRHGSAEVLLLASPDQTWGHVIALRQAPEDGGGPGNR
jgi:hypothetical protein